VMSDEQKQVKSQRSKVKGQKKKSPRREKTLAVATWLVTHHSSLVGKMNDAECSTILAF
jgi:hypothetical protein